MTVRRRKLLATGLVAAASLPALVPGAVRSPTQGEPVTAVNGKVTSAGPAGKLSSA